MGKPTGAASRANDSAIGVPQDWVPVTAGASKLNPTLRALRADSDCTITVKTQLGGNTARTMKFLAGETRYGVFTHVTDITAGTVEGGV